MYALRKLGKSYTADGTGRDMMLIRDKEFSLGRHHAEPFRTASLGRQCHPRQFLNGPKPPSRERVAELNRGLWRCSGQWAQSTSSTRSLPKAVSEASLVSASERYDRSMQVFDAARRAAHQHMTPEPQQQWMQGSHRADGFEASHARLLPADYVRAGRRPPGKS